MIQSFLSFDSMDRTLKHDHALESCLAALYCGAVYFQFQQFVILENVSALDLAMSEVKWLYDQLLTKNSIAKPVGPIPDGEYLTATHHTLTSGLKLVTCTNKI